MSEERTLGVKTGEEITPPSDRRDDNNAPGSKSEVNVDEIESDIDKTLGDQGDEDKGLEDLATDDDGDDTVVVSKSKLEKKLRDGSNYRKGLISLKGKVNQMRKPPAGTQTSTDQSGTKGNDVVTKQELAQTNERMTITSLTKPKLPNGDDNPNYVKELDENWAEVMPYYTPRHGRQTTDAIQQDIFDALTLFRRDHPAKENDEDANAASQISNEKGEPGTKRQGGKPPERKHVLPQSTSAKSWY